MEGPSSDLAFPACCAQCPHLRPFEAACSHELRQSFLRDLDANETCPGYSAAKSRAMRRLSDSL